MCKDITFNCTLNLGAGLPSGFEIGEVSAHSKKGAFPGVTSTLKKSANAIGNSLASDSFLSTSMSKIRRAFHGMDSVILLLPGTFRVAQRVPRIEILKIWQRRRLKVTFFSIDGTVMESIPRVIGSKADEAACCTKRWLGMLTVRQASTRVPCETVAG